VAEPVGVWPALTLDGDVDFPVAEFIAPATPVAGETAELSSLLQPTSHSTADTNSKTTKAMNTFFIALHLLAD
jgi:hypothetical protein